ncbi:MAG: hypothetical protein LBO80_05900, partial [Treponema sp.]|nr:hypothetical protein [Treponema sp.]
LAGISSLEQANAFLWSTYLPRMNGKFSRPPRHPDDAHVRADSAMLDDILCLEYDRKVSDDYIIRFEARLFQILPETQHQSPGPETLSSSVSGWTLPSTSSGKIKPCTPKKLRLFSMIDAPLVPLPEGGHFY